MKNHISLISFCLVSLIFGRTQAQFTFSASPGLHLNGGSFGYQFKKIVPFVGMNILGGKTTYEESGRRFNYDLYEMENYTDKYSASITAFIPVIGAKCFFGSGEKLKPYGILSLSRVFVSGKLEDTDDPTANDEFKKDLKETKIYGTQFGFGTEYFLDEQFSFGGEFGLRLASVKSESESPVDVYNPSTGDYENTTRIDKNGFLASPSYVRFTFNFYFGQ